MQLSCQILLVRVVVNLFFANCCHCSVLCLPADVLYSLLTLAEIAQARATAINTGSVEELAMHRALSEHLFSTFAKPNTVEVVRQNMIKAAIAVSPSAGKRL